MTGPEKIAPVKITEEEFNAKVLKASGTVLVDFYADWCGPCKMIAPLLDELAAEYAGRLSIMKLDVDRAQQVSGSYGVQSIPTLIFFRDGKPVRTVVGAKPKAGLKEEIDKVIAPALA